MLPPDPHRSSRLAPFLNLSLRKQDNSGYIEGSEILQVTERVSRILGLKKAPTPAVNVIFDKVAGPDGRLDKEEFRNLLTKMFKMAEEEAKAKIEQAKAAAVGDKPPAKA
jgi:hypothetical protein